MHMMLDDFKFFLYTNVGIGAELVPSFSSQLSYLLSPTVKSDGGHSSCPVPETFITVRLCWGTTVSI